MRRLTHPRSKLSAIVCATIFAAAVSASAKDGDTRTCETKFGGQVVCGDLVVGITLEQYEAGLNKRAEEIRAEEAEKRVQLQKLMELTERATDAEKDSLRSQIAAVEAEKRALEAESKGVADRLTNLQASYDGLVQKLTEANAALEAFAPLISKDAFEQAQAMLSRGDVLGAERKFVEIADTVRKIRDQADVVEARAIFQAGELAEQRIDWRAAYAHYARAARLQPSNWQYAQNAGNLAREMGDYAAATSFKEAALKHCHIRVRSRRAGNCHGIEQPRAYLPITRALRRGRAALSAGDRDRRKDSRQGSSRRCDPITTISPICFRLRASMPRPSRSIGGRSRSTKSLSAKIIPTLRRDYNNLAALLQDQGKYAEAEPLFGGRSRSTKSLSARIIPTLRRAYNNLAGLLQNQGKYAEAEPLFRRAIEIDEKTLGKDHPDVARGYNNLAGLLQNQGKYAEAEPLFRRAIEIDEKALGKDHPDVASRLQQSRRCASEPGQVCRGRAAPSAGDRDRRKDSRQGSSRRCSRYNNLAGLLQNQGKYAEAEPLYRRAIEIDEKTLGKDHPDVARDYNNLARLLQDQGKYAEAEPLYRRAIEIFQASLGPDHPNTLTVKRNYDGLRQH